MCPVNMLTRHAETNTHKLACTKTHTHTHTNTENHRVSPFLPAGWPLRFYCPALKRDPASSRRLLLSSDVAEDKEMFFLA